MKKKLIVAAAIFCTLVVAILIIVRITGMLLFYKIPTPSSEPTIKVGDWVFTTNLKEPAPYKFIVFTSTYIDSINSGYSPAGSIYLQRLCGIPGNTIEMKNGIFYVDNKNFDTDLNLNKQYKVTNTEFYSLDEEDMNNAAASGGMYMVSKDTGVVTFDNALLKKYSSRINPVPFIMTDTTNGCFAWYDKNRGWTVDNFGPLKIPGSCYFVLGDNRHNALDSRYIGYVKKENIKGVAINK
jgi:signal peptidase I